MKSFFRKATNCFVLSYTNQKCQWFSSYLIKESTSVCWRWWRQNYIYCRGTRTGLTGSLNRNTSSLIQGYVVCSSEKRFLLLFTFLKKNISKKVMVFFSSCNSVKFHSELLNYVDITVLDIHVCKNMHTHVIISMATYRVVKSNRKERLLSLSSAKLIMVSYYVLMLLHVVLIFQKWIGLFNMILLMIQK